MIGTTLVISVAVVAVLGIFLMQQIASGLLNSERNAAVAQANEGLIFAQSDPTLQGPNGSSTPALISLVTQLQSGSGLGNTYDVVLLHRVAGSGLIGVTGQCVSSLAGAAVDVVSDRLGLGHRGLLQCFSTRRRSLRFGVFG